MEMGKTAAEGIVFILLFLSIVQVFVEKVEAEVVMKVSLHPTLNSSDWSNVLFQSRYRANAITSRLHAAINNRNSTYIRRLGARGNVPVVSGNLDGTSYIVSVGFGTPPKQNIKVNFDTAQDVSWLKCDYKSGSSTYKSLDCKSCYRYVDGVGCDGKNQCNLQLQYLNGDQLSAHMSQDTLWLGSQSFKNFGFGCGYDFKGYTSNPSIGRLGLAKGSLSLPSQSKRRIFSYCLPDFLNPKEEGKLRVGLDVSIPSNSKFTAMLSSPIEPSWYFVGISGITVGNTRLNVPPKAFQLHSRGGGTIVDSGVLISQLVKPAYDALTAAFLKQFKLAPRKKSGFTLETCFTYSDDIAKLQIPAITFHFKDGLNLPINRNGILASVADDAVCLMFFPSGGADLSILGTLQQQGYTVSFNQYSKRIGFAPVASCY
jgi:hypothetical protein